MLLAFCANAQSVTDRTSYITNPNFESGANGWVYESLQAQSNSSFTKKSGSVYMEKWVPTGNYVGNGSIYQTITQLPIGTKPSLNYQSVSINSLLLHRI